MIPVLLIVIPLLSGLASFFIKDPKAAKGWALLSSLVTAAISVSGLCLFNQPANLHYDAPWLASLGSRFTVGLDGMGQILCLLNAVAMPVIFVATYRNRYQNPGAFYALMLLTQAGMMGVFLSFDILLFYFFWELALIPAYFLCSQWGGEKRIAVTFKFFIYTFVGSLLMLLGILYLYYKTPEQSFALQAFYNVNLGKGEEAVMFWLFFIAFAIKMPIFPFHTWQPDTYEQAPTAGTMMLSGVMVKMGIFAVLRWLIPVFPSATEQFSQAIIVLSVTGMLYASLVAIRQDDIKRLIAYSSIAHIGLMCAAIFAQNKTGLQGVMIQMFNHGINVIGLWIVADAIESKLGTRKFSQLGGLAQKAPVLAILFVVMALANVALPLTNAFVGEFLMFNGLFQHDIWTTAVAGISIILAAVYTLNMVQRIFYGETTLLTEQAGEAKSNVQWMLVVLAIGIIILGVYPQPLINLTEDTVNAIMAAIK
jgi:NADH-quinone oxidoreductase subunit M